MTPDKPGECGLNKALREAFPGFHAVIHWQTAEAEIVTTFKTYHGTPKGTFLGIQPTGKAIEFEAVDAMRVQDGAAIALPSHKDSVCRHICAWCPRYERSNTLSKSLKS